MAAHFATSGRCLHRTLGKLKGVLPEDIPEKGEQLVFLL